MPAKRKRSSSRSKSTRSKSSRRTFDSSKHKHVKGRLVSIGRSKAAKKSIIRCYGAAWRLAMLQNEDYLLKHGYEPRKAGIPKKGSSAYNHVMKTFKVYKGLLAKYKAKKPSSNSIIHVADAIKKCLSGKKPCDEETAKKIILKATKSVASKKSSSSKSASSHKKSAKRSSSSHKKSAKRSSSKKRVHRKKSANRKSSVKAPKKRSASKKSTRRTKKRSSSKKH